MKNGYIALSTILVITSVSLAIAASVSLISIGNIQTSFSLSRGEETYAFVDGCMEDALAQIASNSAYTGGTISHTGSNCIITATSNGTTYTVTAANDSGEYIRRLEAVATRSSSITLFRWREL